MSKCPFCRNATVESPWEQAVGMCQACADTYGVMPMLASRRPPLPCVRCNSMQFIRAVPRELTSKSYGEINAQISSPMTVTYAPEVRDGWLVKSASPIDSRKAYGYLEQYICRKCGFVEWYCNDPERVPIGPAFMTEAIDYGDTDTPYRG